MTIEASDKRLDNFPWKIVVKIIMEETQIIAFILQYHGLLKLKYKPNGLRYSLAVCLN